LIIPCPLAFSEYNRTMGAINDFDRLLSFHSVKLQSRKWWHAIFYFLIDVAGVNALHLWRWEQFPEERDWTTRRVWIAGLIEEILNKYGARGGAEVQDPGTKTDYDGPSSRPEKNTGGGHGSHRGLALAADVLASDQRLKDSHFPAKGRKRGNCALCYHCLSSKAGEKQVVWHCDQCQVMLHVPECFLEWHTKKKPKSSFV